MALKILSHKLAQEFFEHLLSAGGGVDRADPERGRFRSYLLGALKHFLAEHRMTAGAVKVAIHRLRQGFGEAVRLEISQTVNTPAEVSEELRYLIEVLS